MIAGFLFVKNIVIANETVSLEKIISKEKIQSEDDSQCEVYFIHADDVSLYVGFPAGEVDVYTFTS